MNNLLFPVNHVVQYKLSQYSQIEIHYNQVEKTRKKIQKVFHSKETEINNEVCFNGVETRINDQFIVTKNGIYDFPCFINDPDKKGVN